MSKESHKEESKPHPAKDNPSEHSEIPRTRDGSQDDKKDPYKDPAKK